MLIDCQLAVSVCCVGCVSSVLAVCVLLCDACVVIVCNVYDVSMCCVM